MIKNVVLDIDRNEDDEILRMIKGMNVVSESETCLFSVKIVYFYVCIYD